MAALILPMIAVGVYMTDYLPKDAENRMQIYGLHKSVGIVVLILLIVRIFNRFKNPSPSLPNSISTLDQILSKIAHLGLYLLMLTVPLSGYLMSNSFGYPVYLFSIKMPFITSIDVEMAKIFAEIHEISAFSLLGLVAIHVAAVFKHAFFDKTKANLLKRMV